MKKTLLYLILSCSIILANAQTTFYNATFSGGLSPWTTVDNTGANAGVWQYLNDTIDAPNAGNFLFNSTTSANGFMLFMSDAATNDGLPEDADLISPAINCTGKNYVFLNFESFFAHFTDQIGEGKVYVSNDNVNWTDVYTVSQSSTTNPEDVTVDITSVAANQASVYVKFNFRGDWDLFWAVDDIKLLVPVEFDVAVTSISNAPFASPGNQTISGTLDNRGGAIITSVALSYAFNGGTPVVQNLTGLAIYPFETYTYNFSQQASLTNTISYNTVVTASSPNGSLDAVPSNNSKTKEISILSAFPKKNVVIEELTTAPCQFCPMGGTTVENIYNENSATVIPVALHSGFGSDAMTTTFDTAIVKAFYSGNASGGAPALMVDRVLQEGETEVPFGLASNADYSETNWRDATLARIPAIVPVAIKASNTYDSLTRELIVDATAIYFTQIQNCAHRLNCYIIEDSVSGNGAGYRQVNYFHDQENGPFNPWYGKGDPIINYQHRHVSRYMLGGPWGSIASIPATVNNGDEFTKQYTFTIPANWNKKRITLIALVQNYNTDLADRNIINAIEFSLNSADSIAVGPVTSITDVANPVNGITIFPNPTSSVLNVDYSVTETANLSFEIYNMIGQNLKTVTAPATSAGTYRTQINTSTFENGVYFLAIKATDRTIQTIKFVVNK